MADVRSLLRNERASRRVSHPFAVYSTTGTLSCSLCHTHIKSESLWSSHLKSAQHITLLERGRAGATYAVQGNKKRKADDEDEQDDLRKRPKPANRLPNGFFEDKAGVDLDDIIGVEGEERTTIVPSIINGTYEAALRPPRAQPSTSPGQPAGLVDPSAKGASATPTATIDEDEWAAFERDVATLPPESSAVAALKAAATISAAPLTAAEIAAKSREEASIQTKERREAELEGEKEDAARRLEEEFDDMEELEERVRRLREKREEIRRKRENGVEDGGGSDSAATALTDTAGDRLAIDKEEDDEEDEEDEDWASWVLR